MSAFLLNVACFHVAGCRSSCFGHCAVAESAFRLHGEPRGGACSAPLGDPPGTRLRGPAGSLSCSVWQGPAELGSTSLKQAAVLFHANPALLAHVNGTNSGAHSTIYVFLMVPTLRVGTGLLGRSAAGCSNRPPLYADAQRPSQCSCAERTFSPRTCNLIMVFALNVTL